MFKPNNEKKEKGPESLYYSLEILNPNSQNNDIHSPATTSTTPAEITANNNIPVLDNPNDYYMTVLTASIPLRNVPLFQILIQTPIPTVNDINTTIYSITLQYQNPSGAVIATSAQTYLIYEPRNYYDVPNYSYPAPVQIYSPYYYCYQVQQITDMMNVAFASALTSLKAQGGTGAIAAAVAPFINYDAVTQLLTITSEEAFYDIESPFAYIAVYCNALAEPFFSGFPKITNPISPSTPDGVDRQLIIKSYNGINVSGGIISTIQNYTNYGYWSFVKRITVVTNMNINSEIFYLNQTNQQQENAITYGNKLIQNQQYVNVLFSFLPDLSQLEQELAAATKIQIYNAPTNLYNPITFNQCTPLYNFNIGIYVIDKFGNSFLLPISPNDSCHFKFQFIRKDLVKF
ncbi:MAG: hypothetical protein KGZ34_04455 [Nitrosarchaeum sp.]|nr:hypothetical protein [Nitrosarchaeum sp.]